MKVTHIDLVASKEKVATFSFKDPNSLLPYMVRAVVGIDADEIVPKFYGVGLNSGDRFFDFTRKPRVIVLRLVLNPNRKINFGYSDLRDDLYRVISASRNGDVKLLFKQGPVVIAGVSGKIVKFEVPHFTEVAEVQLTINCDDSMLRGISPIDLYESELSNGTDAVYIYDAVSTAPHGVMFEATFLANVSEFVMRDGSQSDWHFRVVYPFQIGDVLVFSSRENVKRLYLLRDEEIIEIADRLDMSSVWPVVFPGANLYSLEDRASYKITSASYFTAFWGV